MSQDKRKVHGFRNLIIQFLQFFFLQLSLRADFQRTSFGFKTLVRTISLIVVGPNEQATTLQFYAVRWPQDYGWGSSSSYFSLLLLLRILLLLFLLLLHLLLVLLLLLLLDGLLPRSSRTAASAAFLYCEQWPAAGPPNHPAYHWSCSLLRASQSQTSLFPFLMKCCLAWSRSPPYINIVVLIISLNQAINQMRVMKIVTILFTIKCCRTNIPPAS